ncbi:unnamed protein product [Allacma fusca]|uniref:Protein kinase domain-containing protein n=1 Tax=Allacma fusca TaxID=39272 RepID=A0A8J2K717_9HEXA|nr:unnamed protein product [Allacma fusca]
MPGMENLSPNVKRRRRKSDGKITEYFLKKKSSRRRKNALRNCRLINKAGTSQDEAEASTMKEDNIFFSSKELVVLDHVGSGGFGKVFKVKTDEGRVYALKCLELEEDGSDIPEFLECKLQRSISHDNIVKAFQSIQESPGRRCILMEYCSEGNLYDYMCSKSFRVTSRRSKKYVVNIIDGLVHLHTEMGYIHMDLKPENVLITSTDVAKITDFGCVVKMASFRNLMKDHNGGTTTYMPPEMLRKQGFDSTVDVWDLGCITFELYFEEHPFFPDLAKTNFECTPEIQEAALVKMDDACCGRLFQNRTKIPTLRLRAFLNSILGKPREQRPLSTELRNSIWLSQYN